MEKYRGSFWSRFASRFMPGGSDVNSRWLGALFERQRRLWTWLLAHCCCLGASASWRCRSHGYRLDGMCRTELSSHLVHAPWKSWAIPNQGKKMMEMAWMPVVLIHLGAILPAPSPFFFLVFIFLLFSSSFLVSVLLPSLFLNLLLLVRVASGRSRPPFPPLRLPYWATPLVLHLQQAAALRYLPSTWKEAVYVCGLAVSAGWFLYLCVVVQLLGAAGTAPYLFI